MNEPTGPRSLARRAAVVYASAVAALTLHLPLGAQEVVDLPGTDRALNPNFETVYTVGSFDGEEWETFGEIGGLAFDAAGNLYIFDRQSMRVVKVDRGGGFVAEIGQAGDGPGEFRMPVQFTVLRDGTVVVADMGHRAYTLFGPDGAFLRSVSMGGDGGVLRVGEMQSDPLGTAVISGGGGMSISMTAGPGGMPELPRDRPIERISLAGGEAEAATLARGWMPPREERPQEFSGGGARIVMAVTQRTWEPGLHVGVLPDGGVVYADSTAYDLKIVDAKGAPLRILRRPLKPRAVTEAMMEAERQRQLEELESAGGPRIRMVTQGPGGSRQEVGGDAILEMLRSRVEQLRFYPELPVVRRLATGWEGTIWVERRGEEPEGPGPIDLIQPDGRYVGTFAADAVRIPGAFGPDGLAAWVELDEFDVPTVVVKRLPTGIR